MGGGIFDFFSGNEPKRQDLGFSPLGDEVKKQGLWIKHLHNYSRDLHKYASYIEGSNTKHKKEIVSELNKVNGWIIHLNDSHNSLKQEVSSLKSELRKNLKSDFELYYKAIEEYMRLRFDQEKTNKDSLKAELLEELKLTLNKRITNADNAKPVKDIMHYNAAPDLTNPEKELLNLLFNENKPMTYEAIAKKLNKSLNSVRVYMNSLRSKKQIIEEFSTQNGAKVFSIKNSELVKTLFNIR